MPKTACTTQCPQCPFRRTSLPGWLGDYTVGEVYSTVWKGQPFYCHTQAKALYERPGWEERLARSGKLCLGSIRFATLIRATVHDADPDVLALREVHGQNTSIECMEAREFGHWHTARDMTEFSRRRSAAGLTHKALV